MVQRTRFLGLPEEPAPDLKRRVVNWLAAEPEIGRRYRLWIGESQFLMIITSEQDDMWIMWDVRSSGNNEQYRYTVPRGHWKHHVRKGTMLCEDWL